MKDLVQDLLSTKQIPAYKSFRVQTAIVPATTYYSAHDAHQMYLEKNENGYCNHKIRFKWENMDMDKVEQLNKKTKNGFFKQNDQNSEIEPEKKVMATGKLELDGSEGEELATFGAGCYWGTEKYYVSNF